MKNLYRWINIIVINLDENHWRSDCFVCFNIIFDRVIFMNLESHALVTESTWQSSLDYWRRKREKLNLVLQSGREWLQLLELPTKRTVENVAWPTSAHVAWQKHTGVWQDRVFSTNGNLLVDCGRKVRKLLLCHWNRPLVPSSGVTSLRSKGSRHSCPVLLWTMELAVQNFLSNWTKWIDHQFSVV